jgi:hypothetical protein
MSTPPAQPPANGFFRSLIRWFDADYIPEGAEALRQTPKQVDWPRSIPFVVLHLACFGVIWVGVLPDSAGGWMSPDLKVYLTTITISDTVDWLKPGMTAKVEVLVDRLPDVVYVPVQAVTPQDGHQVCHVIRGGSSEPRTVEIGQFNDEFVEIKQGLKAGEKVLLRPPDASTRGGDEKTKPATPAAKAAAPMAKPQ